MRPLEGILNKKSIKDLLTRLKKNGSKFSYRKVNNKKRKFMSQTLQYLMH